MRQRASSAAGGASLGAGAGTGAAVGVAVPAAGVAGTTQRFTVSEDAGAVQVNPSAHTPWAKVRSGLKMT